MCGIVATTGAARGDVMGGCMAQAHRGPDGFGVACRGGVTLGHVRLAVIDVDRRSDQPMQRGRTTVAYNGEIWNWRQLRQELQDSGCAFSTESDTEVLAYLLDAFGWEGLRKVDGMFAVAWTQDDDALWLARDRFGEIPLHFTEHAAASELKGLAAAGLGTAAAYVPAGEAIRLHPAEPQRVFQFHGNGQPATFAGTFEQAAWELRASVQAAVANRLMADVPVCVLLSGGLDSTVVAWAAMQVQPVVAYTAVQDPKSADLKTARIVAERFGIELREVPVPVPTRDDLRRTVEAIEMAYKAQVEIGWPCVHLARRIREDGFKVVLSGEGSDELWGSYGFAYHGIRAEGWHQYRRRLFLEQHRKNFARCNKVFLSHGVECRLPFLHPPLVEHAWSLPMDRVRLARRPKAVLEEAFGDVLPREVLTRQKMAFQDGLGMKAHAAAAIGEQGAHAFYREMFEEIYGATADHRRGAGANGRSAAAHHRRVRTQVGQPLLPLA